MDFRNISEKQGKAANDILISIIIPFYNHINMTIDCLKSITDTTISTKNNCTFSYEIVLVDDCSNEPYDINELKAGCNSTSIIINSCNLGFAKSCNIGADNASGNYLVFLNNDTIALEGWLDNLIMAIRSQRSVGIVGSKLLYEDHTIQHAGVAFDEDNMPFHIYSGLPASFRGANKLREYQAVTGACFIIEKDLFYNMLMFDEKFLNGFEDIDLCLRLRQANYKILYCPDSCLYHLESKTKTLNSPTHRQNQDLFSAKWSSSPLTDYQSYFDEDLTGLDVNKDMPGTKFAELVTELQSLKSSNQIDIAVWGAGGGGARAFQFLQILGMTPDFFIDKDASKVGSTLKDRMIYLPDYLVDLKQNRQRRVFIFVASMWYVEISTYLTEAGFKMNEDFIRIV